MVARRPADPRPPRPSRRLGGQTIAPLTVLPSPWVGFVLALAAFRIARFVGWDDLPVLVRIRAAVTKENRRHRGVAIYDTDLWYERPVLAKFLHCPWCVGFWIGCAVYVAWLEEPRWTLYVLAPFALNAIVGLVAKNLDP